MNKLQSRKTFGVNNASPQLQGSQSPLVQDVRRQKRAGREPTSYVEAYWPLYVGIGVPSVIFGALITVLIITGAARPIIGLMTLFFGLPFALLSFLLISLFVTRTLSSVRSGSETIGNVSLLARTNTGFKLGGLIGLGLFLWFTPEVFGDPFKGNASAKSAIIAQLLLKSIGFIGFFGMVFSRLENFVRKEVEGKAFEKSQHQTMNSSAQKIHPASKIPEEIRAILHEWPKRAALTMSLLAFVGQVIGKFVSGQEQSAGNLIGAAVFCVLAYAVLNFYLKILNKVFRGMSGLYGFSIGAR